MRTSFSSPSVSRSGQHGLTSASRHSRSLEVEMQPPMNSFQYPLEGYADTRRLTRNRISCPDTVERYRLGTRHVADECRQSHSTNGASDTSVTSSSAFIGVYR